ncbi:MULTISPECIES: outer membrane protein assembly factor BamB [unclassified Bordetella]|uniref:outer membrane protein assembly factor BamB n=1 Tax=unclassified Bordetella TaxID=2630031 RepID=UPI00132704F9|nr:MULTISPECIES: outer membrane protein assembly factor BamB [unclassified Bordetella]MVW72217.1 outer membrane protein assembly factor BamB [Bordetella sp. 15P40C-2]MVW78876.1 outer membrane protein assembly factor BamB [Bordetella sp. 02P26C-1]
MTYFRFPRAVRCAAFAASLMVLGGCSLFSSNDDRYEPAPLTEYAPGLSVRSVWSTSIGSGSGLGFVPAVVGDQVYAATPNGMVVKVDLASGRTLWKADADMKLSAGPGSDGTTTVVASPTGALVAFDDTGKVKWKAQASSDVDIPPAVGYGAVIVRSGDYRIQAYNVETGERLWSLQRPGPALALRSSAQMVLAEGLVITGMPGGKLLAINVGSGNVQWEGTVATPRGTSDLERLTDVVGEPQLAPPGLLCAVAYQGRIVCFNVSQGGRPMWAKDYSSASGMVIDGRFAYAPDQNSVVNAFALDNGNNVWKQSALKNRKLTAPAALNGAIAVGDLDGYVHFLSSSDGSLLARMSVGGGAIVSPLQATPSGVLVQTGNGNLVLLGIN